MNIHFTHISLVFEFAESGFNSKEIYNSIKPIAIEIVTANKLLIPDDWSLYFKAAYTNARIPLVLKNKIGGYPSEK